jgi:hypothetical protein
LGISRKRNLGFSSTITRNGNILVRSEALRGGYLKMFKHEDKLLRIDVKGYLEGLVEVVKEGMRWGFTRFGAE